MINNLSFMPYGAKLKGNTNFSKQSHEFLVALAGNMMLMPGLSKVPAAVGMTINTDGNIDGLF